MDWNASLDTSKVVGPAEEATAALGAMRSAVEAASAALAGAAAAAASSPFAKAAADAEKAAKGQKAAGGAAASSASSAAAAQKKAADAAFLSTRSDAKKGGWSPEKEAYELAKRSRIAAKGAGANAVEVAKLEQKEGEALERLKSSERKKADYLRTGGLKALGVGAAAVAAGVGAASAAYGSLVKLAAAATGVGSFEDLAKLAIGVRAMGQLQGIAARTSVAFRGMLRGVDAQPLVRAVDLFSRNFTTSTVTGRALGDVLTRSFNGFFALVEKVEPVATGAFQGMLLGALTVENAWLRLRIAAHPIVEPLMKAVDATGALEAAGKLAAAPFEKLAGDIGKIKIALDVASAAYDKLKASGRLADVGQATGATATLGVLGALLGSGQAKEGDKAGEGGSGVGGAMGDGIVAGLDAKQGAIYDAGKRATDAAVRGAKDGAEIRSPSRKMRREVGRQLGEGVALGEEDMEGRVQKAASSLVPDPPSVGLAARGGGGASLVGPLVHVGQIVVGTMGDLSGELRRILEAEAAHAAERLGIGPART